MRKSEFIALKGKVDNFEVTKEVKIMHPYLGLIMFCAVVAIVIAIVLNKKKK